MKYKDLVKEHCAAIEKLEEFCEGTNLSGYIYKYGLMSDCNGKGSLVAFTHANTERKLENMIRKVSVAFNASVRVQREFDRTNQTWYATIAIPVPFQPKEAGEITGWQLEHPLF